MTRISLFLAITSLMANCSDEPINKNDLIVGSWNSYASGTVQDGVGPGIGTLTIAYEHGLTFLEDGTFGVRYYNFFTETWSEGPIVGNYQIKGDTILLTYFPGTADEYPLDLPILKLSKNHLWFSVQLFGAEFEHHLERVHE